MIEIGMKDDLLSDNSCNFGNLYKEQQNNVRFTFSVGDTTQMVY